MIRINGVGYEKGVCTYITVDGVIDNETDPNATITFKRVKHNRFINFIKKIKNVKRKKENE